MFKKYSTIFALVIIALFFLSGCGQATPPVLNPAGNSPAKAVTSTPIVKPAVTSSPQAVEKSAEPPAQVLPKSYQLSVAFAQQAPFANWDAVHEEACEEASMIMADKFYKMQPLDESIMEQEIQKLIAWEKDRGYQVDLTADETVSVLKNYFGLKAEIITEVTTERIKTEVFKGRLILVPAAGRLLHNPNFKGAGPIYHMLVVKGWNSKQFVTNDPGTRKGNSYVYDYATLLNAVHDWNPELAQGGMTDEEMARGRQVIIAVSR